MRWPTGTEIAIATALIAAAIVLMAMAFPGLLPKLPDVLTAFGTLAPVVTAIFTAALFLSTYLLWRAS